MSYYISRGGQQYGPYSLADVQKYIAQGSISPSDYARTENMANWAPLSQLLASAAPAATPPAQPAQPPQPQMGPAAQPQPQRPAYQPQPQAPQPQPQPQMGAAQPQAAAFGQGGFAAAAAPAMQPFQAAPAMGGPVPPSMHWALVLVLALVTCGLFSLVWIFIEASFVKKIKPTSKVIMMYALGIILEFAGAFLSSFLSVVLGAAGGDSASMVLLASSIGMLAYLAAIVLIIMGHFKMRSALLEYYNTVEPINLRLSGVMTFFFNVLYFQYHFSRIAEWKRTGVLAPQG